MLKVLRHRRLRTSLNQWRWDNAHTGEPWMLDMLPAAQARSLQQAAAALARTLGRPDRAGAIRRYWRIRDASHRDVVRATRLLAGLPDANARRWLAEIRRNNTVVTMDVCGGYPKDRPGPVVLDVRNAENVSFKLYRVRSAQELVAVSDRIGRDYMYRDYGLQDHGGWEILQQMDRLSRHAEWADFADDEAHPLPWAAVKSNLVVAWEAHVGALKMVRRPRSSYQETLDDGWDNHPQGVFFDDACRRHELRIVKDYRPEPGSDSAWVCDRVVDIPASGLARAGAYVLVAEANGQRAVAPIVVEPLSLTLRRCRDGVFVMVSTPDGSRGVGGATVHAWQMLNRPKTRADGATFAKVLATGARSVIVESDGRYAIGGFGRLFEGLYYTFNRRMSGMKRMVERLRRAARPARDGWPKVYADRTILAAYTDRPVYRPGQTVRFKLIARKAAKVPWSASAPDLPDTFRAEDFDAPLRLSLPAEGTALPYQLIDPRGRAVAAGTLTLNDYGTAAGQATLGAEAALGEYSLRIAVDGTRRIVPDVFAVKAFRRPNVLFAIAGVPDVIRQPVPVKLAVAGEYGFGKPLAGAKVEARLVRGSHWLVRSRASGTLDAKGHASLTLHIPPDLAAGDYAVICTLTDASGRTVTKSRPCRIELPGAAAAVSGVSALPRFVPAGKTVSVETTSGKIVATQWRGGGERKREVAFTPNAAGRAAVTLTHPGWYTLTDGKTEARLFVYGGTDPPDATRYEPVKKARTDEPRSRTKHLPAGSQPQWVNLTRYMGEDGTEDDRDYEGDWDEAWNDEADEVLALFEGHHAEVGRTVRVLVYTPHRSARLLLTLEGRTVADYHIVTVGAADSAYHVVELPITRRHVPNVYLRGRLLWASDEWARPLKAQEEKLKELAELEQALADDDGSEDPRWCRIDVLDPNPPSAERLKVSVKTDRAQYRPGRKVSVTLHVTDMQGKGRQAEVSLGAVDESVYSFGEDALSSLAGAFSRIAPPRRYLQKKWRSYRSEQWSADRPARRVEQIQRAAEALKQLQDAAQAVAEVSRDAPTLAAAPGTAGGEARRRARLAQLGQMPVGTLASARLRTDFRATAAWMPQLRTDASGVARASFALPDSLTAYRLSAVALTKDTRIGTGRAGITVTMPLSAQVFLPRFAVENDRLQAVALIHNTSSKPRTCDIAWEVSGASAAGAKTGKLLVPARGTARAGLWIVTDTVGRATVTFRAGDATDTDAERRSLDVYPLGRERRVALNGQFTGRKVLALPRGFVAGDLAITLARSEALGALDGLGYLVGYPYGCVEQTMSRFLPAVMVQRAADDVAAALDPDVRRKLPDVLARGLARLYNFQHADGGWGWWEKDKTNDRMTVYVVYGLARCRAGGTTVDSDVLRRGCEYLLGRLAAAGTKAKGAPASLSADLQARAHLALALAGRADRTLLVNGAKAAETDATAQARCNLALACTEMKLPARAKALWHAAAGREPKATGDIALKLMTAAAMSAPPGQRGPIVSALLARKKGHRWQSTRATSWAIEALSSELTAAAGGEPAKGVTVRVGGKTVLNVTGAAELRKLVHRVRLARPALPNTEALPIELQVDCDGPVNFSLTAVGTQRLDKVEPIGTSIRMTRRYAEVGGKPLGGAVKVGRAVAVHVTVELAEAQQYVIVEDRRPTGMEFAHDRLLGPAASRAANVEFRDDRVCAFFTDLPAGKHELVYVLRAETPWTGHVLPGAAYPMYKETVRGETAAARLTVVP